MKSMFVVAIVLVALLTVNVHADDDDFDDDNDFCSGPGDTRNCEPDECCARSRLGGYRCKDRGDTNDRCGGEYSCPCEFGYECIPDSNKFTNFFRVGTGFCRRTFRG